MHSMAKNRGVYTFNGQTVQCIHSMIELWNVYNAYIPQCKPWNMDQRGNDLGKYSRHQYVQGPE